ncbi:MAG: four helix bundle protein [Candidatus Doudnabacteria bacterium]|nr:four helix bundle protein [Candidatus Doudnabacteria bacterium]
MLIKTFRDLIAWQKAHNLTLGVYKITDKFPKTETFGLTSQMRRCAVSVPSNIAEGFKRRTKNDSVHFYNIAEGALEELKYQLLLARDLGYISDKEYRSLNDLADEVGKLTNGWKRVQK